MFGWAQNVFRNFSAAVDKVARWHLSLYCLLLAGCTTPLVTVEERPDWLIRLPDSARLFYGVGASPTGEQPTSALHRARSAATADLFTQMRRSLLTQTPPPVVKGLSGWYGQSAESRIAELTQADVKWLEAWESSDNMVYVWAALERERAAHRLRQVYLENQSRVVGLPGMGDGDAWANLQRWAQVLAVAAEQQARNELHQWLVEQPIEADWSKQQAQLEQAWREYQASMPMRLFLSEATPVGWAPKLIQPWVAEQFVFAPGDWQLRFHATESVQGTGESQQVTYSLEVFLLDPEAILKWQHHTEHRQLAKQTDQARLQALQQLAEAVFSAWQQELLN